MKAVQTSRLDKIHNISNHRLSSKVVCLHILFLFHDAQVAVDLVDIARDLNEKSITAGE